MARIALLCPDLLFGSKLESALAAAGHDLTRFDGEDMARAAAPESDLLIVDLTGDQFDGPMLVESMKMGRELGEVPVLGFYSHVDQQTRARALEAGFDMVVPRSRMAREAAAVTAQALSLR